MLEVGMTRTFTPVEEYPSLGLWVKREDLCCPGGPNFSKTRGVYPHVAKRTESIIGVLDTAHSQGGWAVARACALLGKRCLLFYPVRKAELDAPLRLQQEAARQLGASLVRLQAGRSAVLYHQARRATQEARGYMMPNALKLPETVEETAAEFARTRLPLVDTILVSASSGTIAAGVFLGAHRAGWLGKIVVHLGYSRPERAVRAYMEKMAGVPLGQCEIVDEGYSYADAARSGVEPPFPSNSFYDLKLFRWWIKIGRERFGKALLWNIG